RSGSGESPDEPKEETPLGSSGEVFGRAPPVPASTSPFERLASKPFWPCYFLRFRLRSGTCRGAPSHWPIRQVTRSLPARLAGWLTKRIRRVPAFVRHTKPLLPTWFSPARTGGREAGCVQPAVYPHVRKVSHASAFPNFQTYCQQKPY